MKEYINPLQKSCDACFLLGCRHEADWGHPCDRDEDGYYECELRARMLPDGTVDEFLGFKWQEVPENLRDEFNAVKANFPKTNGVRWVAPQLVKAFEKCTASVNWEPPQLLPEEAKMLMQLNVADENFHYWMVARQAILEFMGN